MLGNGILETTTTTGTGDLTTSAVTGRPRFTDKFTANATEASAGHFYYAILTQDNPPQLLETGIGWMSATGTLKRQVVLSTYASSTLTDTGSITAATLPSGTKNVICTAEAGSAAGIALPGIDNSLSASRIVYSDHIIGQQYGTGLVVTANRLYLQPFLYNGSRPVDGIFFRNSATSGNVRVALFECNRDGTPGRKIMGSTGDQAVTAGVAYTVTTGGPVRIPPGWYYLAYVADAGVTINVANSGWVSRSNPLGHDGVSKWYSYGYLANGSTTIADPASAVTTKVTSDTSPLGLGLRVVG